ncbi:MAG: hypothetical protein ACAH80_00420 [Alphaproteobacteria bacterium]
MGFKLRNIFRRQAPPRREYLPRDFNLEKRRDEALLSLDYAAKMIDRLNYKGEKLEEQGFSMGGFKATVVTNDGQADGIPKIDPATILVSDKNGAPLLSIAICYDENRDVKYNATGATPAVQTVLDAMPANFRGNPEEEMEAIVGSLTSTHEIAASVAYVKSGVLHGPSHEMRAQAVQEHERREATARQVTADRKMKDIVEGSTVLKEPLKAGSAIKLKTPV